MSIPFLFFSKHSNGLGNYDLRTFKHMMVAPDRGRPYVIYVKQ